MYSSDTYVHRYIVSDCGAVSCIMGDHHFTNTTDDTCAAALQGGCDLDCGGLLSQCAEAVPSLYNLYGRFLCRIVRRICMDIPMCALHVSCTAQVTKKTRGLGEKDVDTALVTSPRNQIMMTSLFAWPLVNESIGVKE